MERPWRSTNPIVKHKTHRYSWAHSKHLHQVSKSTKATYSKTQKHNTSKLIIKLLSTTVLCSKHKNYIKWQNVTATVKHNTSKLIIKLLSTTVLCSKHKNYIKWRNVLFRPNFDIQQSIKHPRSLLPRCEGTMTTKIELALLKITHFDFREYLTPKIVFWTIALFGSRNNI